METLATRFRTIMDGLRAAIGMHVARDRTREALFALLWNRIGRMANRFGTLVSKWRAGTLPKPRPSRAGQPGKPRAPRPRLPQGRTWLVAQVGYTAAGHASQLQHLLADPDMAAFLQAAPQAGRILRPLCRMLGMAPPPPPANPANTSSLVPARARPAARTERDVVAANDAPSRSRATSPLPLPRFSPA